MRSHVPSRDLLLFPLILGDDGLFPPCYSSSSGISYSSLRLIQILDTSILPYKVSGRLVDDRRELVLPFVLFEAIDELDATGVRPHVVHLRFHLKLRGPLR